MCEQITFDSAVFERLTQEMIYNAVRPYIDSVLEKFNFSPSHIKHFIINDGMSLRYNIKNSLFSSICKTEDSPGSRVILRIKSNKRSTIAEVPATRQQYYDRKELPFVPTKAQRIDWQKIEITYDRLPALTESVCNDISDYLLHYPSDFGCCSRNEECSVAGKCIQPNQDMAAGCYYKRNLMQGKIFYSENDKAVNQMLPPKGEWKKFVDKEDENNHFMMWGFPKKPAQVFYNGYYSDGIVHCDVVGYKDATTAVIKVCNYLHCIHGEYLREMQPKHEKLDGIPSEYIVLDLETTSKYVAYAKIVEVAAIKCIDGKEVAKFSSLVNPNCKIPSSSTQLHGITDDDVKDAPAWRDVQGPLLDFIGNLPIVGHNVSYDIDVTQMHCHMWLNNPCIDTVQRAKKAFPVADDLTKNLGIKNYKLDHLKDRLNLSTEQSHRALGDVRTTNALLWICENPKSFYQVE